MTAFFGLDESVVGPLVRAVAPAGLSKEQVEEYFARASWTGIAEPGDRLAGQLVSALGARRALTALIDRWDIPTIISAVISAGAEVTAEEIDLAVQRWHPRVKSSAVVTALRQAVRLSVALLLPGDDGWPAGVDDLEVHAPLALWVRGYRSTLASTSTSIALVGARAATGYGEHVTMEASAGLVDRGYTIVSGAAYGIDGMAHRAALASSGQTVAFLAGGVDRFYPSGHDALLTRIVESGAVVSELPCGSPPTKWRFLQRNRLIAAASQATIVLEAGWRSGSLNTAGHAASLGRPLGAVPGPVTSAASAGCHRLIRDFYATCVTNVDEMAELAPLPSAMAGLEIAAESAAHPTSERTRVIDALSARSARTTNDVAARAGLSASQVQSVLGILALEGGARQGESGWMLSRT